MQRNENYWLKLRIIFFLFLFTLVFFILIYEAFKIQIISSENFKKIARKQHIKVFQWPKERGLILDCNGVNFAASIMMDSICAEPSKIIDQNQAILELSKIFPDKKKYIETKIKSNKHFCWIARIVSPEQALAINKLKIDGIYLIKEPKRVYPNKMLASHIIGFVGNDSNGLSGLELKYDDFLKRQSEEILWGRDAKGNILFLQDNALSQTTISQECHILLTIDSRIQYLVDSQLNEAVNKTNAKGGLAIVMVPKTGAILAMAQSPEFNLNLFNQTSAENKKNRAVMDCFDPGSTFKPFVAAAALQEGVIKDTDIFYCENGSYLVANRFFHEAHMHKYKNLTFKEILKYSSNIGLIKISEKLGKEKLYQYINEFGFGSKTGIDLPGESPGILRNYNQWTIVDTSTISFGQGIAVTAIQMTAALAAIANGGLLMKPYLVKGLIDSNGRFLKKTFPSVVRRVLSPEISNKMIAALVDVVDAQDGTGKKAKLDNIIVAGKTGTSQKFDFTIHKYSSEKVRTSFMGFFPANNAKIVLFIMLDEPQKDKWGGIAAAPVFHNISEQIISRYENSLENYQY